MSATIKCVNTSDTRKYLTFDLPMADLTKIFSQLDSSDLLSNFLVPQDEPSSFISRQKGAHSLAPKFGGSNRTLNDEGGEQELLERLSNISSQSSKSKRTLPKPSDAGRGGDQTDLLSLIQNDTGKPTEPATFW